ncbi:hypothetical protein [Halolamina sp. C58]|uniref:hypothetical protein n=1 Tax=Halolamina sp. C58 TaxID=3421640 RepID=UPI003EC0DAA7
MSPALPVTEELRFGLGILVVGTGLLAYTAGSLAVLERIEDGDGASAASRDGAPTADD